MREGRRDGGEEEKGWGRGEGGEEKRKGKGQAEKVVLNIREGDFSCWQNTLNVPVSSGSNLYFALFCFQKLQSFFRLHLQLKQMSVTCLKKICLEMCIRLKIAHYTCPMHDFPLNF